MSWKKLILLTESPHHVRYSGIKGVNAFGNDQGRDISLNMLADQKAKVGYQYG
jgi:hypothetical protein